MEKGKHVLSLQWSMLRLGLWRAMPQDYDAIDATAVDATKLRGLSLILVST